MTETAPDVLGWLRTRAIADAAGDGAMFQEAATLLYDFKINAKALLVHCDSTGTRAGGSARRVRSVMRPNAKNQGLPKAVPLD